MFERKLSLLEVLADEQSAVRVASVEKMKKMVDVGFRFFRLLVLLALQVFSDV